MVEGLQKESTIRCKLYATEEATFTTPFGVLTNNRPSCARTCGNGSCAACKTRCSAEKMAKIALTAITIGMMKYRPSLRASYDASLVSRCLLLRVRTVVMVFPKGVFYVFFVFRS